MPAKRGGSSTQGKSGPAEKKVEKKSEPSAMDAQNTDELIQYMKKKYGISMYKSDLDKADFETIKEQVSALEEVLQEFPGAQKAFRGFEVLKPKAMAKPSYYAQASMMSGVIMLNSKYFANPTAANAKYKLDLATKFHPEGTTLRNVTTHEAGHILERALVLKYLPSVSDYAARVDAYSGGRFADEVVRRAVNRLGKADKSMGKSYLREQISRYATTNFQETLAEGVADYMANRSKAKPLSKAIYKV